MRKNFPLYICICCFIILNIFLIFNIINCKNNQEEYFRLHIVANSNSVDDQIIKLNVVKKINNYLDDLYNSSTQLNNKEDSKVLIHNNMAKLLVVANNELKEQNTDYTCYANIGKISYDAKTSELLNMDKGIYDSIQIVLGEGNGQNFWSLIFPYSYNPNYNITKENENILSENIEIKSKLIETIEKVVKTFKS